jgi:hypothetical protein
LFLSGELKAMPGVGLRLAITILSSLFLVGIGIIFFLPETKGQELIE